MVGKNQHRIMDVVVQDQPDRATPGRVKGILQDMRRFVNEHNSNPSSSGFSEWSGTEYTHNVPYCLFGSWKNAVEAVGGEPNSQAGGLKEEDLRSAVNDVSQRRLEYEKDGEKKISPEGKAPPAKDIFHIERLPNSYTPFQKACGMTYTEIADEQGWETEQAPAPNNEYDWRDVMQTLKREIQNHVRWESEDRDIPEGEIPPTGYIDQHDELPTEPALRGKLGRKEEWPNELASMGDRRDEGGIRQ